MDLWYCFAFVFLVVETTDEYVGINEMEEWQIMLFVDVRGWISHSLDLCFCRMCILHSLWRILWKAKLLGFCNFAGWMIKVTEGLAAAYDIVVRSSQGLGRIINACISLKVAVSTISHVLGCSCTWRGMLLIIIGQRKVLSGYTQIGSVLVV